MFEMTRDDPKFDAETASSHEPSSPPSVGGGEDVFRFVRVPSPLTVGEELVMRRVIGAAIAVHRELGPGFMEPIYRRAMCQELSYREIAYETERRVAVKYRNAVVGEHRFDLLVNGLVVVELKAVAASNPVHRAQVLSYLRAARLRAGLVINFRVALLKEGLERIVL